MDAAGLISDGFKGCRHILCSCTHRGARAECAAASDPDAALQLRGVMAEAKKEQKSEIRGEVRQN